VFKQVVLCYRYFIVHQNHFWT